MNYLLTRLAAIDNPDPRMWIDEAIWGHRFHDEQTPWLVFLEFLNVFFYEEANQRALFEKDGPNSLRYRPARRLELRNILFNNPKLFEIKNKQIPDNNKWIEWCSSMKDAPGVADPRFDYIRSRVNSFDDFASLVSILQSTSLEVDTNKRWTSKFVFPYGPSCLFEDLNKDASTNDRNFFGRTGELLYLMLCRCDDKRALRKALLPLINGTRSRWDAVVRSFQPDIPAQSGSELGKCYLPYEKHPTYDQLAKDWLACLSLNMPGFDALPHLVSLIGLHLIKYQLTVARDIAQITDPYMMICEIIAPRKTLVRELSCEIYQSNNLLTSQAVDSYINNIEQSSEWRACRQSASPFVSCLRYLEDEHKWRLEYDGPPDPDSLMAEFKRAAKKRHQQHVANVHRSYGKAIGLVSKRGASKLRYAPSDGLLKSIIFANVRQRMEFNAFLDHIYERYGLIFGDKEAVLTLGASEIDIKAFQANAKRLEQRLASLGLLKRLSDGCAYVLNPFSGGVS
ncbi:MAG: hypothetical protein GX465_06000 [Acidobacteria bacterium]|nr:hypothetical protein [Acidobacteriota bacterium]